MRSLAALLGVSLLLITLPLAGALSAEDAQDVVTPVQGTLDDLPLVWCQAVDCGPHAVLHFVAGLVHGGTHTDPDAWPVVDCAAVDCGPTGWLAPFLP